MADFQHFLFFLNSGSVGHLRIHRQQSLARACFGFSSVFVAGMGCCSYPMYLFRTSFKHDLNNFDFCLWGRSGLGPNAAAVWKDGGQAADGRHDVII